MSDDLNDEQLVLASAYLDGAVTSAERARVEADPQLLAEVERLRSVRTALAEPAATAISTRERHLAAALGAWDRLSDAERAGDNSDGIPPVTADPAAAAGAATVTAPTSLADRRKRGRETRSGWMLTAAAAVLVIAGGGLIARGIIDSESSHSSVATESAELPPQRAELNDAAADEVFATEEPADVAAELAPQAETAIGSTTGRPDDVEVIDSPEALADFAKKQLAFDAELARDAERSLETAEPTAEAPAEEPAEEPVEVDAAPSDAADGAIETVPALAETDLTETDLTETGLSGSVDLTCGLVDRIIADAEYGSGLYPEPVAIGVDGAETEVVAFRVDTCEVIARAALVG